MNNGETNRQMTSNIKWQLIFTYPGHCKGTLNYWMLYENRDPKRDQNFDMAAGALLTLPPRRV